MENFDVLMRLTNIFPKLLSFDTIKNKITFFLLIKGERKNIDFDADEFIDLHIKNLVDTYLYEKKHGNQTLINISYTDILFAIKKRIVFFCGDIF